MKSTVLFAICALHVLTACGGNSVKDTLGLGRRAPDEFKVVARPPLSVPPQFSLRPPSANAESPIVVPADKQAKSIITGASPEIENSSVDTAVTPVEAVTLEPATSKKGKKGKLAERQVVGESQFMKNIGVDKADPKVRDELIGQTIAVQEKKEEAGWWERLTMSSSEKKDTLVSAKEEAERIKSNQAGKKPVTEGDTPTVTEKNRGVIGNIFGW